VQLENTFTVPVSIDDAFAVFLDVERVAACLPGATLDTVDGDDFTGNVKVKLGPIALVYKGSASLVEKDEQARRLVLVANGRDARGNGTASARVTVLLGKDADDSTRVDVLTDLEITGKPAQFGKGVIADVSAKLIDQFAASLAATLAEAAPVVPTADVPDRLAEPAVAAELSLIRTAGPAVARRAVPALVVLVLVFLLGRYSRSV
jgi:carbon monoxide dehydrogenase subunit G